MAISRSERSASRWREIAFAFLKLGATAYGGPAIMGIMQAELQERRQWVTKERFVEGLSLVNMLPGAAATQLGIFLGYSRGGWLGGLIAGLCFVLPAFAIMLALSLGHTAFGTTPGLKGALHGLGPVVLGIFLVAVIRLGRSAVSMLPQLAITLAAAAAAALSPLGVVPILALAGAAGLILYDSRRRGALVLGTLLTLIAILHYPPWSASSLIAVDASTRAATQAPALIELGSFFLAVGAFSFGGGLTLIAFIQEHVVNHAQWLTQREFIDGLALGQFTPGPILMVAAFVGYKLAGFAGAAVAAAAIFLPAFVLMLSLVPIFERVRRILWMKAALKAVGPAVIGVLAVSLGQMAPHALPDPFAAGVFLATVGALLAWRVGVLKLMALGAFVGLMRDRLLALPGIRGML